MRAMMKIFAPKSGQLLVSKGVRIDLNPALDFMTSLGPDKVISVNFVPPQVIVWYWEFDDEAEDHRVEEEEKRAAECKSGKSEEATDKEEGGSEEGRLLRG